MVGGLGRDEVRDLDAVVGEYPEAHHVSAPWLSSKRAPSRPNRCLRWGSDPRSRFALSPHRRVSRRRNLRAARAVGRAADARFDQLAPAGLGQPAQQRSETAADLIVMRFQLTLDEAARRGRSRRALRRHGSRLDRVVLGPTHSDRPRGSASRGLVYGLLISLLLWAGIALAIWSCLA